MTINSKDNILPMEQHNEKSASTASNPTKDFVFEKAMFDIEALSSLQSIFDSADSAGSKSASVKFMITSKDKSDLQLLGYSIEQINQLKPQEAEDILKSGTKAEPTIGQE
ncbi:MAG: hypothetical protein RW306_02575 [Geobacteraceae bacterium]|nr:hypothetical protein [Geobacteraceae bacterium]